MGNFTQWSTLAGLLSKKQTWVPTEDQDRLAAYNKYDEMYWNDPTQFALRVLEDEQPLYIPNARTVVDTTAHYVLKGLNLKVPNAEGGSKSLRVALDAFLDRELFYSRFHIAKHAGVARGDFVFHLTADPRKPAGRRISLNAVDPASVFPIYDDDLPDKMVGCHLAEEYYLPDEPDRTRVRRLTYRLEEQSDGTRRVSREEAIFALEPKWYGPKAERIKTTIPFGYLDSAIQALPIYWFKNLDWDGQLFGSSELRGFESILQSVSQGSTDVSTSLALEGLGVYATDGGRPVNNDGTESDWEVSPGKVMEVPSGSYFRRVEGVGSITPATDQLNYLETKLREGTALSDVALGRVDVQTASSGIALAIKFMPTLAKVEERDTAGLGRLKQMFYDWKIWHQVFEHETLEGEIVPEIGDKLPSNRTERVNELNNMLDRKVISKKYYREEMGKLGYVFPPDIEGEIEKELQKDAERAAATAPAGLQDNAAAAATGALPPPAGGGMAEKAAANRSNNKDRPNESSGTESGQPLERQARGGTSR
jgi:hypothetical protein